MSAVASTAWVEVEPEAEAAAEAAAAGVGIGVHYCWSSLRQMTFAFDVLEVISGSRGQGCRVWRR